MMGRTVSGSLIILFPGLGKTSAHRHGIFVEGMNKQGSQTSSSLSGTGVKVCSFLMIALRDKTVISWM